MQVVQSKTESSILSNAASATSSPKTRRKFFNPGARNIQERIAEERNGDNREVDVSVDIEGDDWAYDKSNN